MATRTRRGQEVEIPEEWIGRTTDRQTIRKRQSKLTRQMRNRLTRRLIHGAYRNPRERIEARAPKQSEWDY